MNLKLLKEKRRWDNQSSLPLRFQITLAENIISHGLETSVEIDMETLCGWVEEIKKNPKYPKTILKPFIRKQL